MRRTHLARTLRGDLKKSYDCNQEAIQYASTTLVPDASREVLVATQQLSQAELEIPSRKTSKSNIQSTGDVALKTIQLQEGDSSKTAVIGAGLDGKYELGLVSFLRANRDIFTWKPADMPGVPRELIEHCLNVHPQAVPKKQCLRRFAHDKLEAIKREIAKLLAAGFIKKVIHPEWVAYPVLVRKKNNEWRMCVDYTDLNKHCPKDHFGLPRIDQVVDSTAGCVLLCFIDFYSGYHQIALKEEDQIKTAFITPFGTYGYKNYVFRFEKCRSNLSTRDSDVLC
jgi:hypothetical protein